MTDPIWGELLYAKILDSNHFLVKAKGLINWDAFSNRCLRWYAGGGQVGRPPYNPATLLRMLFYSYLYNLSERVTEEAVNDSLSAKYFLGLGVNEPAPDHSSLTYFKERLLAGGGKTAYDELLREILTQAKELGVVFGSVQIVDSTHVIANVNTDKDIKRIDKDGKGPRDPDASWGAKRAKISKDPETGETKKQIEYFHGYKAFTSYNSRSGLITAVVSTTGKVYDGHYLKPIIAKDRFSPVPKKPTNEAGEQETLIYTADRGFDDGENHEYLKDRGLGDAIRLNNYRTKKKDDNKAPWIALRETKEYKEGLCQRYKIEPKYGEAKMSHGFKRCRSTGGKRFHLQAILTAVILNLKVVVARCSGVTLRGYAWSPT